jgi:hypothetical protein
MTKEEEWTDRMVAGPESSINVFTQIDCHLLDPQNELVYFFAAAFCFAQRLRCASAILFLPAADMVLFFGVAGDGYVCGRPPRLEAVPARKVRADRRRAISASMAERMSR